MRKIVIVDEDKILEYVALADLHPIAISGDFNALKNKPNLGTYAPPETPIVSLNDNFPIYQIGSGVLNGLIRSLHKKPFQIKIPLQTDPTMATWKNGDMVTVVLLEEGSVGEIVPVSGVKLYNADNEFKFTGKGNAISIFKVGDNEYILSGKTTK